MSTIQESLEFILKSIIKDSKDITVESQEKDAFVILEISAPQELVGQVIGKEGKIIKSIRTILNLSYPNTRFSLDIKN